MTASDVYGGQNLYGFVGNDGVNNWDYLGLAQFKHLTRKSGKVPRLSYSCRCGWIDWGHANPKSAKSLWASVQNEGKAKRSRLGGGFKLRYGQSGFLGVASFHNEYYVKTGLSEAEQKSVALAVFKEVSTGFEGSQFSIGGSNFSVEDLVSNLIGFYRAVEGYSVDDIKQWCVVLDEDDSKAVWKQLYGKARILPEKNDKWKPVLHEKINCCKVSPRFPGYEFPEQFKKINEAKKGGGLFREWRKTTSRFNHHKFDEIQEISTGL